MQRRRVAWLLSLGLTAAGGLLAHLLAYRLLLPAGEHAAHHHAGPAQVRLCLAACGSVALVGLVVSLFDRARAGRAPAAPVWIFALVPPAGFVLQEQLSWALHRGSDGPVALHLTALVLGLVAQIPFAVAAYLAAQTILRLATAFAGSFRRPPRLRLLPPPLARPDVFASRLGPAVRPSFGLGQRAPPIPA